MQTFLAFSVAGSLMPTSSKYSCAFFQSLATKYFKHFIVSNQLLYCLKPFAAIMHSIIFEQLIPKWSCWSEK